MKLTQAIMDTLQAISEQNDKIHRIPLTINGKGKSGAASLKRAAKKRNNIKLHQKGR